MRASDLTYLSIFQGIVLDHDYTETSTFFQAGTYTTWQGISPYSTTLSFKNAPAREIGPLGKHPSLAVLSLILTFDLFEKKRVLP
jgi:hypothetical protein